MRYSDIQIGLRPGEEPEKKAGVDHRSVGVRLWEATARLEWCRLCLKQDTVDAMDLNDRVPPPDEFDPNASKNLAGSLPSWARQQGLVKDSGRSYRPSTPGRKSMRIVIWEVIIPQGRSKAARLVQQLERKVDELQRERGESDGNQEERTVRR